MFCLELHGNCVFDALGKAEPLRSTAVRQMDRETADLHAKDEGRRSNGSSMRAQTNGQTDRRTLPSALSPSLRGR